MSSCSPGLAVQRAGPAAILSFVLAGVLVLLSALSFAEVAAHAPPGGSGYAYVGVALGRRLGFLTSWAFVHLDRAHFTSFSLNGAGSVLTTSSLLFVAYLGFNVVTNMAGDVERPQRTIPLAIRLRLPRRHRPSRTFRSTIAHGARRARPRARTEEAMSPDSLAVELVALAATVAAVVLLDLLWDVGRSRPRIVLRSVAVILCLATAAATGLLWVNRQVDAHLIWASLLGSAISTTPTAWTPSLSRIRISCSRVTRNGCSTIAPKRPPGRTPRPTRLRPLRPDCRGVQGPDRQREPRRAAGRRRRPSQRPRARVQ